ncbi:putative protein kinase UbiB [Kordiimonas sediminis]|uniref:ABC1 atypical kinase-like domain-containing protein n=1 Tax=Kordiimonas sediminis TaxID=1735581 RepID=A0A919E501_9PROT|nr:2-polyprenylphenol 6-hydroxylase [Kordiimonas sediminis]GHF12804.1 putative protein kinase UbiB [Kordiimonas sediminis]
MIRTLRFLLQLFGLAARMRRYGAIRSLTHIEMVPRWAPTTLRILTFYIPRKVSLPDDDGERLAAALAGMGPAYIKLGQTLATRPDVIGHKLAKGLTALQDRLPPFSGALAIDIIETELGGTLADHFSSFETDAIAAASIAQVHKAVTTDGQAVAVKVRRPGIEGRFKKDIALFDWLATLAETHVPTAKRLRLRSVVDKLRETVSQEMDMRIEGAAATELSQNMKGESGYRVPVIDWARTGSMVLTLEWVDGIRLADSEKLQAAGHDLEYLGERVVQVFLKQAVRDGYFHADLHQGNLIVEEDGTIVAIDFGIMGRLSKKERRFLAEILYGFIMRDYRRVAEVHFDAGYVPREQSVEEFSVALRAIADPILDLPVEEISAGALLAQLFATTERFKMQTQPQLLLLQRTMVMAEGMALHLNPKTNMWQTSRPVLEGWIRDNLSPEARLADFIVSLPRLLERLPTTLERLSEEKKTPEVEPIVIEKGTGTLGVLIIFALGIVLGTYLTAL